MNRIPLFFPLILATLLLSVLPQKVALGEDSVSRAVVRIFVTSTPVNPDRPWAPDPPREAAGTGFVLEGQRILTNAHVVEYATYITVQRSGDTRRFRAEVAHVSHDADLAILTPVDAAFFDGIAPLELGDMPAVREEVTVMGYPAGGSELSYSSGIVSRIEVNAYAHSWRGLLTVQVDAPINPGNSGGPAVRDGRVAGMVMMGQRGADGVGYLIPPVIIRHFLDDIEDGRVDGHPKVAMRTMAMENRMQRDFHGLDPDGDLGVLLLDLDDDFAAATGLRAGDIIVAIDSAPVHSDRRVRVGKHFVFYTHLLAIRQVGDTVEFTVLRDGTPRMLRFAAAAYPDLVPFRYYEKEYPYFLFGGFVFTPLYYDFIRTFGGSWPDAELHFWSDGRLRRASRRQVVFLHTILDHESTAGIPLRWQIVHSVDGERVRDFAHFVRLLENAEGWCAVAFDSGAVLRLDTDACRAAQRGIAEAYGIPQRTPAGLARITGE